LDGIGWGSALRELLAAGAPDGEVPVPLRHAVVQVLDGWLPAATASFDGVVFIESDTRPQLVRHLATGLAKYRSVPVLTTFEIVDHRPPVSGTNSARRLAAVLGRHRLADPGAVAGTRILLVDDATDTGWTLTVAARELRRAGASAVYPLVLAVR
jgi:ATP-dependent DNA helicase RecQ